MKQLTLVGVFLAMATMSRAQTAPNEGSSQCGGVQKAVQLSVGDFDPSVYRNHGEYVSAVAKRTSQAVSSGLISSSCSACITNQFARKLHIADQESCGDIVAPSGSCGEVKPTAAQIQTSAVLALGAFPDAWNNSSQFNAVLTLSEEMLGCQLRSSLQASAVSSQLPRASALLLQPEGCAVPGVNYCGPGNSATNPLLKVVQVPACLNQACCAHDECYDANCVDSKCNFTPQTQQCDDPLLATCNQLASCSGSGLEKLMGIFVCAIAECLNGSGFLCTELRAARLLIHPQCLQPSTCNSLTGNWAGTATVTDVGGLPETVPVSAFINQTGDSFTVTLVFTGPGDVPEIHTETGQITGTEIGLAITSQGLLVNVVGSLSSDDLHMSGTGTDPDDQTKWIGSVSSDGKHISGNAASAAGDTVTWSLDRQ